MGEKLGKILKEKKTSEEPQQQVLACQPAQPAPPQGYPPYQYPSPAYNPNYPYDRSLYPPQQPVQQPPQQGGQVSKPAVQGELFKMEKISQGKKDFVLLSIAVDENLADFRLGKLMVAQ